MLYIHKNDEHEQPNEAVTTVDVYKKSRSAQTPARKQLKHDIGNK